MDETDDGPVDLVPPSPVATSTQVSFLRHEPPLPQLVIPGSPVARQQLQSSRSLLSPVPTQFPDNSSSQLSPIVTYTPGSSRLSPVATSTQQPAGTRLLMSPIATSTQHARSSRPLFSPVVTASQQPSSSRAEAISLNDWVVRRPGGTEVHLAATSVHGGLANEQVLVDGSDDDVIEIEEGSTDGEIVSVDSNESEPEDGNSDTNSNGLQQPESPQYVGDDNDVQQAGGEDAQNTTLVGPEEPALPATHQEVSLSILEGRQTEEVQPPNTDSLIIPGPAPVPHSTPGATSHIVALTGQRESPADFRSPKRRRVISPAKSSIKEGEKAEEDDMEDGECCPICFEPWTTSGNHRLSSLKCGHLFGQSCIDKWLKGQGGKCPHCNAKAKRQDIRVIYAKSIRALDTSEKDRALKDLENEKEARRKAEMEAAELRLKYQLAVEESNKLRTELEGLRQKMKLVGGAASTVGGAIARRNPNEVFSGSQVTGHFMLDKTIKIWDAGNCRAMAYSASLATLVVSQPSSSPLFPGFGVKKISTLDLKTSQYMTVHSKAIRDISFHPTVDNGLLLSCGLDKKVKVTSLLSNAVVQSYDTPMPAWSCVWNTDDRNYFYTGLQNGLVLEFDIRNTENCVQEINSSGSRSPVAALKYMAKNLQATFSAGGLLMGQLDRVQFFESLPSSHFRPHILPLDGSLTSLYIDPSTRHILASFRPTARNPTVRHQLCELVWLNLSDAACSCNVVFTFNGGKTQTVLSKTVLFKHPSDNNRLLVCAGNESDSSVYVWDSGSGQRIQILPVGGITVDTCPLVINQQVFLAALTDKKLNLFKWC